MRIRSLLGLTSIAVLALSGCSPEDNQNSISTSAAGSDACGDATCTSILFTGDLLVHNSLWTQAEADAQETGNTPMGFAPLIAEQKPYVESADLAVCQMETPVAEQDGPYSGYPSFNVPSQILKAAKETGWDACMTASNHSVDQGAEGLERAYHTVQYQGMGVTGTNLTEEEFQEPDVFTTANGAKVAVITGTYGLNGNKPEHDWQVDMLDADAMISKAQKAQEQGADIVVANMHAGTEYVSDATDQQVTVAHQLVDSDKFDLIVGEHDHTVQPIEKYKDTWIVYCMVNNITELSPYYASNNEGIMVNAIATQQDDGSWSISKLRWASSSMVGTPNYRYCITSPERPDSSCISETAADASHARVKAIVESAGGAEQGLEEWQK